MHQCHQEMRTRPARFYEALSNGNTLLSPVTLFERQFLQILARILVDLRRPRWLHLLLPAGDALSAARLPDGQDRQALAFQELVPNV